MIVCPNCNQELPDNAKYCGNCSALVQADASDDPFIGKSINNKYLIQKRIASGGMGEVYLAIQKGVGQEVAIKKLRPEYYRDGEIVKRFIDEARSYGKITHPNAVKLHDLLNVNGQLCIIMEFVHGKTLTQYIESGTLFSIRQIIDISLQLADALGTVHRAGIIHRDLKTENVMLLETVTGRFSVKILDFGIAKFMDRRDRATKDGAIVGTPEFMSPEQCYGLTVDHRADIYAFGILMFVMICCKLPFEAENPLALLKMQAEAAVPRCTRPDHSEVPADIEAIVNKCLMKSPSDRYQSFEEVIADLTAVQEGGHVSIASVEALSKSQDISLDLDIAVDESVDSAPASGDMPADSPKESDTPSENMAFLGNLDVSQETSGEPEFTLDGEEDGDGLVIGSLSDTPAVVTPERRSGHAGAVIAVLVLLAALGIGGYWYMNHQAAPENPVSGNGDAVQAAAIPQKPEEPRSDEVQPVNGAEEHGMEALAAPEPPKEPDPVAASTAVSRRTLIAGLTSAVMDKSDVLLNAGDLDSADGMFAYIENCKSDLDPASVTRYEALTAKNTTFREMLKTATKTKNGAKDGRACEPIAALQKDLPEEAVGMREKIDKLLQSCHKNLSAVPDVL